MGRPGCRQGGFFLERWGDAPVHSLAAALLLNASQVGPKSTLSTLIWEPADLPIALPQAWLCREGHRTHCGTHHEGAHSRRRSAHSTTPHVCRSTGFQTLGTGTTACSTALPRGATTARAMPSRPSTFTVPALAGVPSRCCRPCWCWGAQLQQGCCSEMLWSCQPSGNPEQAVQLHAVAKHQPAPGRCPCTIHMQRLAAAYRLCAGAFVHRSVVKACACRCHQQWADFTARAAKSGQAKPGFPT